MNATLPYSWLNMTDEECLLAILHTVCSAHVVFPGFSSLPVIQRRLQLKLLAQNEQSPGTPAS